MLPRAVHLFGVLGLYLYAGVFGSEYRVNAVVSYVHAAFGCVQIIFAGCRVIVL